MKKALPIILVLLVALSTTGVALAQDVEYGPVTQKIVDNNEVVCGINGVLPGFGAFNPELSTYEGFDTELCRAVAVAILGDASRVNFLEVPAAELGVVLRIGDVDMLVSDTNWTIGRDTTWNATFGPIVFYDGQGVMVRNDSEIADVSGLADMTICVEDASTAESNLASILATRGISAELNSFRTLDDAAQAFFAGEEGCDAVTGDRTALISERALDTNPSRYLLLGETLFRQPISPVTSQDDPQFAEIVRWTVYGLMNAEALGITSENVDEFLESDNLEVQQLLGIGDTPSGSYLGLQNDFMVEVIRQVGNYGEIYERNLGAETPFSLNRGLNNLWFNGGLIYAPPFGG
ncbi:MAG: transporter substrate-binding domain-containing protein [Chloroflexota bacterium]